MTPRKDQYVTSQYIVKRKGCYDLIIKINDQLGENSAGIMVLSKENLVVLMAQLTIDTVEPRFNEVAGDRPYLFVKWRVRYIENLDITNLRGNDQNCSLYRGHS